MKENKIKNKENVNNIIRWILFFIFIIIAIIIYSNNKILGFTMTIGAFTVTPYFWSKVEKIKPNYSRKLKTSLPFCIIISSMIAFAYQIIMLCK